MGNALKTLKESKASILEKAIACTHPDWQRKENRYNPSHGYIIAEYNSPNEETYCWVLIPPSYGRPLTFKKSSLVIIEE